MMGTPDPAAADATRSETASRAVAAVCAAVIVVAAVLAVAVRADASSTSFPYLSGGFATPSIPNPEGGTDLPNRLSHWHAALGVYACNKWLDDGSGPGVWLWPARTSYGSPALAVDPSVYAGLHSHGDGLIHIEPGSPSEEGANATLGRYFTEGGWRLSSTGFDFLDTTAQNGDRCGSAAGTLHWYVNGREHTGDPAAYRIRNGDVIAVAFTSDGANPGDPPSARNLPAVQRP